MIAIYGDNFRGFHDTLVELKQVNFLVGENSTGKTSMLSLFALFHDVSFWFTHDFNTEIVRLGYFDEIASSPNDAKFRVGFAQTRTRARKEGTLYYLLSFENRENIPTLAEIRVRSEQVDVYAKSTADSVLYHVAQPRNTQLTFGDWVRRQAPGDLKTADLKNTPIHMQRRTLHSYLLAIEGSLEAAEKRQSLWITFLSNYGNTNLAWTAPIRAKPRRTYDSYKVSFSPEGDHAPYLLKDLLDRSKKKNAERTISSFGKKSGLFSHITIRPHGKGKTAPFEIYVQLGRKKFRISNVGYGVAQVLPIIVELLARPANTWFNIQQPEVHLHPKAQAALGSMIFQFARSNGARFLIETHSDYLVDRFRREMHDEPSAALSAQLLFFTREADKNSVTPITIGNAGQYEPPIPEGFRDFFIKEQLSLLPL